MKDFVIKIFALVFLIIGITAALCEIIGLIDPEGYDKPVLYFFAVTIVISFLISCFLWKLSNRSDKREIDADQSP